MQQNGNVALLSTARRESKIFSREETIGQRIARLGCGNASQSNPEVDKIVKDI